MLSGQVKCCNYFLVNRAATLWSLVTIIYQLFNYCLLVILGALRRDEIAVSKMFSKLCKMNVFMSKYFWYSNE